MASDLNGNELVTIIGVTSNKKSGKKRYTNAGNIASAPATFGDTSTALYQTTGNVSKVAYLAAGAIAPAATGADNVLAVYTIPANAFDEAGRSLFISASGVLGANTNNKQCKIIFNPDTAVVGSTVGAGGTTIADTGVSTANGAGWRLEAQVTKVGAANSNTQFAQLISGAVGATGLGVGVPLFPTATENADILVAVTGNATTTAADIKLNAFFIRAAN